MIIEKMSAQHQFVWNTLTLLEDGERILGPDLQSRAGIRERRGLYQIIKELRVNGYLVGSSKNGKAGYYQVRDQQDLDETLHVLRSAALDTLATADAMEASFGIKKTQEVDLDGK